MARGGKKDRKGGKKKDKRVVPHALAHIQATFNNTKISVTDPEGNMLGWASAGKIGFKGSRKGTPFAAQVAGQNAGNLVRDLGVRSVDVLVRGPGGGRESAIRALQSCGITVQSIKDVTPIPHNGCRPRKRRRV